MHLPNQDDFMKREKSDCCEQNINIMNKPIKYGHLVNFLLILPLLALVVAIHYSIFEVRSNRFPIRCPEYGTYNNSNATKVYYCFNKETGEQIDLQYYKRSDVNDYKIRFSLKE